MQVSCDGESCIVPVIRVNSLIAPLMKIPRVTLPIVLLAWLHLSPLRTGQTGTSTAFELE